MIRTHPFRFANSRARLLAVMLALTGCALTAAALESVGDLAEILSKRGIVFDAEAARQAAVEGMLRAVDPASRILSREQALEMGFSLPDLPAETATNAPAARTNRCMAVSSAEEIPGGFAVLKVVRLSPGAGAEVSRQLRELAGCPGRNGLILDLRDAAGHDLDAVSAVAGLVTGPAAILFRVLDSGGQTVAVHESRSESALGVPLMVLVNGGTSEAAELLAAVLRGRRGVMIIGQPTAGDDGVRELIPLSGGRYLYIASKRATLADGSSYGGGRGVRPDVEVAAGTAPDGKAVPEEAQDKEARRRQRLEADPVLARAADILLGLKALGVHAAGQTADPSR